MTRFWQARLNLDDIREAIASLESDDVSKWTNRDEADAEDVRTVARKLFEAATEAIEERDARQRGKERT